MPTNRHNPEPELTADAGGRLIIPRDHCRLNVPAEDMPCVIPHPETGELIAVSQNHWKALRQVCLGIRRVSPTHGKPAWMSLEGGAKKARMARGTWIEAIRFWAGLNLLECERRGGKGSGASTNLHRITNPHVLQFFPVLAKSKGVDNGLSAKEVSSKRASVVENRRQAPDSHKHRAYKGELTGDAPTYPAVAGFQEGLSEVCRTRIGDWELARLVLWTLATLQIEPAQFAKRLGRVDSHLTNPYGFWRSAVVRDAVRTGKLNSAEYAAWPDVGKRTSAAVSAGASENQRTATAPEPSREQRPRGYGASVPDAPGGDDSYGEDEPGSSGELCSDTPAGNGVCDAQVPTGAEPAPVPERPDYYAGLARRGIDAAAVMEWLGADRLATLQAIHTEADIDALAGRYRATRRAASAHAMPARGDRTSPHRARSRGAPAGKPNCGICADSGLCGWTGRDTSDIAGVRAAVADDGCWFCKCQAGAGLEKRAAEGS